MKTMKSEDFANLSRDERRANYVFLSKEEKQKARRSIEARRGIAYRMDGGVIVRTKEELTRIILSHAEKLSDLPRREVAIKNRIAFFKEQVQEHYGEDALSDVENAIEELSATLNK